MTDILWNHDKPLTDLGIEPPAWIDQDITGADIAAIVQGGCASGAYMPAVTYHSALAVMADHGDQVLDYLVATMGELPEHDDCISWAGLAVHYLSHAVDLWACCIEDEAIEAIQGAA